MIKKVYMVPIGLPGLGKTTMAKRFDKAMHLICYDNMLLTHQQHYQQQNPETPFHEVIDIIRPIADQQYIKEITEQNYHQQYIFLDRNNTPDIWNDIYQAVGQASETVLLLPQQPLFSPMVLYGFHNPISPQLFYHSAKRIFRRSQHQCLSGADKPKAIEVLLKFTRLYDNVHFDRHSFTKSITLDYDLQQIHESTMQVISEGIRLTPASGFKAPSDEVIEEVIKACELQIIKDDQ